MLPDSWGDDSKVGGPGILAGRDDLNGAGETGHLDIRTDLARYPAVLAEDGQRPGTEHALRIEAGGGGGDG